MSTPDQIKGPRPGNLETKSAPADEIGSSEPVKEAGHPDEASILGVSIGAAEVPYMPAHRIHQEFLRYKKEVEHFLFNFRAVDESSLTAKKRLAKMEHNFGLQMEELQRELLALKKRHRSELEAIASQIDGCVDAFQNEIDGIRLEMNLKRTDLVREKLVSRLKVIAGEIEQTVQDNSTTGRLYLRMIKEKTPETREAYHEAVLQRTRQRKSGVQLRAEVTSSDERVAKRADPELAARATNVDLGGESSFNVGIGDISALAAEQEPSAARSNIKLNLYDLNAEQMDSRFQCFRDARELHTISLDLVRRCKQSWMDGLDCVENLIKALESFVGKLREIVNENPESLQGGYANQAAESLAQLRLGDLRNLDLLLALKKPLPSNDNQVLMLEAIKPPREDAILRLIKELRDKLYGFAKTYGQIEEIPVKNGTPIANYSGSVEIIETIASGQNRGEKVVHAVVAKGYRARQGNEWRPIQKATVIAIWKP
jgi:hypothetical protein